MRLRNDPMADQKLIDSGILIQDFPFQISKNTTIELGMGKGEMITELASLYPNRQFIGVEKFPTVAAKAAKRANELGLKNFLIICEDIVKLPELLDGKVDEIWLTFSDPWPKARHEKRRLTYKTFLEIYENLLSENGVLKFKTDNDKLFDYSEESMRNFGFQLSNITRDFHNHKSSKNNVKTGYETKWSSIGKNINYLEARKK